MVYSLDMKNYYIYHIPGIKIGCTTNVPHRMQEQGFTEWEHLETYTDIYEVSDREIELQKEYGLPVDTVPYWQAVENRYKFTKEHMSKGGRTNVRTGHLDNIQHLAQASRLEKVECPHCNKVGAKFNMKRWHFDNCKLA